MEERVIVRLSVSKVGRKDRRIVYARVNERGGCEDDVKKSGLGGKTEAEEEQGRAVNRTGKTTPQRQKLQRTCLSLLPSGSQLEIEWGIVLFWYQQFWEVIEKQLG